MLVGKCYIYCFCTESVIMVRCAVISSTLNGSKNPVIGPEARRSCVYIINSCLLKHGAINNKHSRIIQYHKCLASVIKPRYKYLCVWRL